MDVREKLVEILRKPIFPHELVDPIEAVADYLLDSGVTVQECGEWVHPKGYVVSNGFLCSKCGHKEASYYPINPRPRGGCMVDENGNFYHPPKLNYCPNCGAKMMPQAEGE